MTVEERKGRSKLHDWHRDVFTKRTPTTLVFPEYSTMFGGNFPEVRSDVTLASARSVICQRALNELSPDEWKHAQEAFDASPVGQALKDDDVSVRREHCELWLLHQLHESEHPELVHGNELALQKVLAHHAHGDRIDLHKERLLDFCKKGRPPCHAEEVAAEAKAARDAAKGETRKPEVKS